MSERVFVVMQGIAVLGVYTSMDRMFETMPSDVDLEPCPRPEAGWNGRGAYREMRIRMCPLDVARRPAIKWVRPERE